MASDNKEPITGIGDRSSNYGLEIRVELGSRPNKTMNIQEVIF